MPSHNRLYLDTKIKYLHSVTCMRQPITCVINVENSVAIAHDIKSYESLKCEK